jgi:hypothetical protein
MDIEPLVPLPSKSVETNRGELVREISIRQRRRGVFDFTQGWRIWTEPDRRGGYQAIDRTHRIVQMGKVMAYRLLMRESIEQKLRTLQSKRRLRAKSDTGGSAVFVCGRNR